MRDYIRRRDFIKTIAAGSVTLGLADKLAASGILPDQELKRIGIIGLDTSHSVAFTKALNDISLKKPGRKQ